jgi:hypothetical protein
MSRCLPAGRHRPAPDAWSLECAIGSGGQQGVAAADTGLVHPPGDLLHRIHINRRYSSAAHKNSALFFLQEL